MGGSVRELGFCRDGGAVSVCVKRETWGSMAGPSLVMGDEGTVRETVELIHFGTPED